MVVILDGAPIVGSDRSDKLIQVIIKAAKKEAGIVVHSSQIEMKMGDDGKSKGFLFINLRNQYEVDSFKSHLNEYQFDKKHTFKVIPANQLDNYNQLSEQWLEPQKEKWVPRVAHLLPPPHLPAPTEILSFSSRRIGTLQAMVGRWT